MSDKLVGAFVLLFGIYMVVFARHSARQNLRFQDYWLRHRSARVRKQYELSSAKREARLDVLTGIFAVGGFLLVIVGLLVLTGVIKSEGS